MWKKIIGLLCLTMILSSAGNYIELPSTHRNIELGSSIFLPVKISNPTSSVLFIEIRVSGGGGVIVRAKNYNSMDRGIYRSAVLNPNEEIVENIFFTAYRIGSYDPIEDTGPAVKIMLCDLRGEKNCESDNIYKKNGPLDYAILPLTVSHPQDSTVITKFSPDIELPQYVILILLSFLYIIIRYWRNPVRR